MKSLRTRVEALEKALDEATAEETVVKVQLVIVSTRQEVLALERLEAENPEPPRPPAPGRVRLVQLPSIMAREFLLEAGITIPPEIVNQPEEQSE